MLLDCDPSPEPNVILAHFIKTSRNFPKVKNLPDLFSSLATELVSLEISLDEAGCKVDRVDLD